MRTKLTSPSRRPSDHHDQDSKDHVEEVGRAPPRTSLEAVRSDFVPMDEDAEGDLEGHADG